MARTSPSSRRAWIEIFAAMCYSFPPPVALLAEGVDRNSEAIFNKFPENKSPSSRRAWIEILFRPPHLLDFFVALLAEGVDRN